MILIENTETFGWEAAIRGMRNPLASWQKSDTEFSDGIGVPPIIGPNDMSLMRKLADAGPEHGKYLRMIGVSMDVTAPRYFEVQLDTYKIGTVSNSCSTMHTLHKRDLTIDDFSHEHLTGTAESLLQDTITILNVYRGLYNQTHDKEYWWQMIQLLPQSYNQKRTYMLNYAVLKNVYRQRKDHKLDCWHQFCDWIRTLPYAEELILGQAEKQKTDVPLPVALFNAKNDISS